MQLVYDHEAPDAGVSEAITFVNTLFPAEGFWLELAQAPPFKQTSSRFSPALIAQRMQACTDVITIHHFYKDSSTTAYVEPSEPFKIYLNTHWFGRSVGAKVNTLVHECVHVVDQFRDGPDTGRWNYGHTRRYTADRPRSAPYWIGNLGQRWWDVSNKLVADLPPLNSLRDYAAEEDFECGVDAVDGSESEGA